MGSTAATWPRLRNFLVPEDDIEYFIHAIRADNYGLFQSRQGVPKSFRPTKLPEFNISCVKVSTEDGKIIGKTLSELQIRALFGVNVLGINRKDTLMVNVSPDEKILRRDLLYISGSQLDIDRFRKAVD